MESEDGSLATVRSALEELGAPGPVEGTDAYEVECGRLVVCLPPALRQVCAALEDASVHLRGDLEARDLVRSTMLSLASAVESAERLKEAVAGRPALLREC
ncbi:hypothetical protein ACFUJU_25775 [Streptomyces sp. NPDC057235]|uniref:hypothetical protein n=1 Tax=Streptomyces sp. NPDC057235 TaxID=3346058 RepID=UPI003625015E